MRHRQGAARAELTWPRGPGPYNGPEAAGLPMSNFEDLAERVERLVLRHEELKRTNTLLEQQVAALAAERDNLRSRLSAARARIDVLLERLPSGNGTAGVGE